MITINKSILHILDFNSGVAVFSEQELDMQNNSALTFLTKHIERSFLDSNLKPGSFLEKSNFEKQMNNYINRRLDFVEFSTYIADLANSTISKSDKLDSQDLFICDFNLDDERIIGILLCNNKIKNDIINHYTILPNLSQKLDLRRKITLLKTLKFLIIWNQWN